MDRAQLVGFPSGSRPLKKPCEGDLLNCQCSAPLTAWAAPRCAENIHTIFTNAVESCAGGEVDVRGCYTALVIAHMLQLDAPALAKSADAVGFIRQCQVSPFLNQPACMPSPLQPPSLCNLGLILAQSCIYAQWQKLFEHGVRSAHVLVQRSPCRQVA